MSIFGVISSNFSDKVAITIYALLVDKVCNLKYSLSVARNFIY